MDLTGVLFHYSTISHPFLLSLGDKKGLRPFVFIGGQDPMDAALSSLESLQFFSNCSPKNQSPTMLLDCCWNVTPSSC